jgi:hypothetical protein
VKIVKTFRTTSASISKAEAELNQRVNAFCSEEGCVVEKKFEPSILRMDEREFDVAISVIVKKN